MKPRLKYEWHDGKREQSELVATLAERLDAAGLDMQGTADLLEQALVDDAAMSRAADIATSVFRLPSTVTPSEAAGLLGEFVAWFMREYVVARTRELQEYGLVVGPMNLVGFGEGEFDGDTPDLRRLSWSQRGPSSDSRARPPG